MNLIDDFISEDINETYKSKQFQWLKPIVHLRAHQINPFITSDFYDMIFDPNILASPTGKLFCEPGSQMEIDFPEENDIKNIKNPIVSTAATIQSIAKSFTRGSIAHLKDINSTFGFNSTSAFFSNLNTDNSSQPSEGHLKLFTFEIKKITASFKLIEPIICSAFLYSENERQVISDYWNFIPPQIVGIFQKNDIKVCNCTKASFQVDPKMTENGVYLFILFSHPIGLDNSSSMIKYFQNPGPTTEHSAIKKLQQSFPRLKNSFSTFACTFIEFQKIRNAVSQSETFPNPFLIESPLPQEQIKDFMSDALKKSIKQLQITVEIQRVKQFSNLIIRPLLKFRPQPFLSPIHQLSVRINSFKMSSTLKQRNIIIALSVKCSQKTLKCVKTKLNPLEKQELDFSRCFYHNRSPVFDDYFLIDLPYPIPSSAELCFHVFHVHVKQSEQKLTTIGVGSISLFDPKKKSLLLKDGQHSVYLENKDKTKEKDKITFTTYLRSNLSTNNQSLIESYLKAADASSIITNLPPGATVTFMMLILDRILQCLMTSENFSFKSLIDLRDRCIPILEPTKFERFMILFARYFAFKQRDPMKAITIDKNICLNESKKAKKRSINLSASMVSFPVLDLNLNDDSLPPKDILLNLNKSSLKKSQDDEIIRDSLIDFSFRKSISKNMQRVEDDQMAHFLSRLLIQYCRILQNGGGLRTLHNLIDFLFTLIIKGLSVSNIKFFGPEFDTFLSLYCKHITIDLENSKLHAKSLGLFANLLFDIGMGSLSAKVSEYLINTYADKIELQWIIVTYITFAFRPSLFLFSLKYIDSFRFSVIGLLRNTITSNNTGLWPILGILLQMFGCYDKEMTTQVASSLIECLKGYRPNLRPTTYDIVTHLAFFNFLLGNANYTSLKSFIVLGNSKSLFKLAHFMIERMTIKEITFVRQHQIHAKTSHETPDKQPQMKMAYKQRSETLKVKRIEKQKYSTPTPIPIPQSSHSQNSTQNFHVNNDNQFQEKKQDQKAHVKIDTSLNQKPKPSSKPPPPPVIDMVNSTHSSLISFASNFLLVADFSGAASLVRLIYHMLSIEIDAKFYSPLIELFSKIIKKYSPTIFHITSPCLVKVFDKIFSLSTWYGKNNILQLPILSILEADGDDLNKAFAILVRSLSYMDQKSLLNENTTDFFKLLESSGNSFCQKLTKVFTALRNQAYILTDPNSSHEERCDALLLRFISLKESPDAQISTLEKMYQMQQEADNKEEMVNVSMLQIALIAEYLVITHQMKNYFCIEHPATLFLDNVPFASYVVSPSQNPQMVPGFCDSDCFSEFGLCSLIHRVLNICLAGSIFEPAAFLIDILWPIYDYLRLYQNIEQFFSSLKDIFEKEASSPSHISDAMAYRYYKITFYGNVFGNDNKKSYIYRENRLMGLFSLKDKIELKYKNLTSANISIITDSGKVDESTLNNDIGYIQLTFVKPLINKIENKKKENTSIGIQPLYSRFYFESPFVEGTNEKQGSIDKQWLRRTVLTTKYSLPNICKRVPVINESITDFEPIRVVYRQLRERVADIYEAYSLRDGVKLQQLLSGTLVVTVNEGPEKIAEIFLSKNSNDENYKKRKVKLQNEFKKLLNILEKAVLFHGELVLKNPEFVQLQVQLENGLDRLKGLVFKFMEMN